MKPPTVRLHTYLFVASLSAILIQVAVLISILLLHVPERAFDSLAFRAALLAATGFAMLLVYRQGRRARLERDSGSRAQARKHAPRATGASMRAPREPLRTRHRGVAASTPIRPRER